MANSLQDKVREVENEHFANAEHALVSASDEKFFIEAHQFHGALGAVTNIARSLTSKTIEGLMQVEEKKYYVAWGYTRFADYLNSDEVPDFSKNKYYELKALLESEGPKAFDVFSGQKIPRSTRKLLATKGVEITVDGDELVIADKRVPVTDRAAVKELVDAVHEALSERDEREAKKDTKIEKLESQLQRGQDDYEELQRNLDAMRQGNPQERSLADAVYALCEVSRVVGQMTSDEAKSRFGQDALPVLWSALQQVKKSCGTKHVFEDAPKTAQSDLDSIAAQVLAEDDDLD